MEKYKKDYPKLIYKKSSGNLNIFGASDTIAISLTCEPVDPDPEWKFYKKEGLILSSKYFDLAEKENIELGLNKTNSQGF